MPGSKKIKVLQAIRQGQIGGGESHVLSLVGALDRNRYESLVLSFTDGPMITSLREMGIRSIVLPSLRAFDVSCWKQVKALIEKEQVDIVHAHGSRAASNLFLPARLAHRPLMYTIHGWSFHEDQPFLQKQLRIWSEKMLTSGAKANISVSASNRETGVRHFRRFRSTVINNGIDLDRFNPDKAQPDVRRELGIPEHHTVVGYIARITHQKDPLTMIQAFAQVAEKVKDMTLLVVGDGDMKEEMMDLAQSLYLNGRVLFQPFRQDVPAVLKAVDIYCLPSLWEGMPIGLLEAMAMRKAVVVTAADGSCEIVKDQQNGLIIPIKEPAKLAEAIGKLHADAALRQQLQQGAAATVAGSYSVQQMARQVATLYERILKTGN